MEFTLTVRIGRRHAQRSYGTDMGCTDAHAAEVEAQHSPHSAYGTDMATDPDYCQVMADWRDSGRITESEWRNRVHGPGRYTCPATGNSYARCPLLCSHMTQAEYAAWEDGADIPGYPERQALADAARCPLPAPLREPSASTLLARAVHFYGLPVARVETAAQYEARHNGTTVANVLSAVLSLPLPDSHVPDPSGLFPALLRCAMARHFED